MDKGSAENATGQSRAKSEKEEGKNEADEKTRQEIKRQKRAPDRLIDMFIARGQQLL